MSSSRPPVDKISVDSELEPSEGRDEGTEGHSLNEAPQNIAQRVSEAATQLALHYTQQHLIILLGELVAGVAENDARICAIEREGQPLAQGNDTEGS